MNKRNKFRALLLLGVLLSGLCLPLVVSAKGPANVSRGLHNLSSSGWDTGLQAPGMFAADNVDDVCVFCHTPHGGSLTGPLWNRANPTSSWSHYSSATLSDYLKGLPPGRAVSAESLMCMSCHDGSVAVDHLINYPNQLVGNIEVNGDNTGTELTYGFFLGAHIGGSDANTEAVGDLSDDHPISFSYDSVFASYPYTSGAPKDGQLRSVAVAKAWASEGVRFFGSNNRVECSTCHDPHVDYDYTAGDTDYAPFLIMPNAGSNLCLACHNK